jgi:hypothetical protein
MKEKITINLLKIKRKRKEKKYAPTLYYRSMQSEKVAYPAQLH